MALKACRECGQQISSKAKSCPQCGYVPKGGLMQKQFGCGSTLLLIFVCALLYFVITGAGAGGSSSGQSRSFTESDALYLCQQAIKSVMKDPERTKVPYVQNFGTDTEYSFGWGRSTSLVRTRNGIGNEVPATASCTVSKTAEKVNSFTVNGKLIYERDRASKYLHNTQCAAGGALCTIQRVSRPPVTGVRPPSCESVKRFNGRVGVTAAASAACKPPA